MGVLEFALLGLGSGAIIAIFGQAIVVINLGSGVLNFATGASGMLGAYTFYTLYNGRWVSAILALAAALALSAALGAAVHVVVMRRLVNAPATSRIVATLGLMSLALEGVSTFAPSKGIAQLVTSPLPAGTVPIGPGISVGIDRLLITGIAFGVTILLLLAQKRTRLGLATSAVAENRLVAASMGWSPDAVAAITWAVGSAVATGAAICAAAIVSLSAGSLTLLVVPAMAAGLVGGFQSFPRTLAGGLAIGVAESELSRYVSSPGWQTAAPLLVVVLVLALRGRGLPARTETVERRPAVGSGRLRPGLMVLAVTGGFCVFAVPVTWLDSITTTLIFGLLILSVVVVTGYGGQLSLAQAAMAGLGSYFTALLAVESGFPLALAVIGGVIVCTPVALLVALSALRTRGLNLAIATLSLAIAVDSLVLSNPVRITPLASKDLGRLSLFGLDLSGATHPARFALAVLVVLVAAMTAVANLRRGRSGRRLLAVRSNERAAAAMGVSVAGVKIYAFWLSTMLAALAGTLSEARFSSGDFSSFQVLDNINVMLYGVIGGIGWIAATVIGGLGVPGGVAGSIVSSFTTSAGTWIILVGAALAIIVVMWAPDGAAPLSRRQLEAVVRAAEAVASLVRVRRRSSAPDDKGVAALDALPERAVAPARCAQRLLELCDVTVRFHAQTALAQVSLSVRTGEIVGLIGPNGAGKSTVIDVVTGFQAAQSGAVLLDGRAIDRWSAAHRARSGISRSFQSLELFDDMTVLENLRTASDKTSPWHYVTDLLWPKVPRLSDAAEAAIHQFRLADALDARPPDLDYGKRRLVGIARALSSAPSILLLDEPAAGLDAHERRELASLLRTIAQGWGVGVLLVEHDVQMVFSVCDRVAVLDRGAIIADGPAAQVRNDPAVVTAYLGDADASRDGRDAESVARHEGMTAP